MSSLNFIETTIPELFLIERKFIKDNRSEFFRLFCQEELAEINFLKPLQQINFYHV